MSKTNAKEIYLAKIKKVITISIKAFFLA